MEFHAWFGVANKVGGGATCLQIGDLWFHFWVRFGLNLCWVIFNLVLRHFLWKCTTDSLFTCFLNWFKIESLILFLVLSSDNKKYPVRNLHIFLCLGPILAWCRANSDFLKSDSCLFTTRGVYTLMSTSSFLKCFSYIIIKILPKIGLFF